MTILINSNKQLMIASWENLYAATFGFNTPFELSIADGTQLIAAETVSMRPQRRIVVYGYWKNQSVVAKLFLNAHAKREYERELNGLKVLMQHNIPTPAIYYHGKALESTIYLIISKRLTEAKTLQNIWENKSNVESVLPLLRHMMLELATQHVLGITHHDLHLRNFLATKKIIYTLDGDAIEKCDYLMPKKQSMQALAMVIAQFGSIEISQQTNLFKVYAKARGWVIKKQDKQEFLSLIEKTQAKRWQQYSKKIFRTCTAFISLRESHLHAMLDRPAASDAMFALIRDPEKVFTDPHVVHLKSDKKEIMIKKNINNQLFFITRYNINMFNRLCCLFGASPAKTAWRLAHKLKLFNVNASKPIACIENKVWGIVKKAYYIQVAEDTAP